MLLGSSSQEPCYLEEKKQRSVASGDQGTGRLTGRTWEWYGFPVQYSKQSQLHGAEYAPRKRHPAPVHFGDEDNDPLKINTKGKVGRFSAVNTICSRLPRHPGAGGKEENHFQTQYWPH